MQLLQTLVPAHAGGSHGDDGESSSNLILNLAEVLSSTLSTEEDEESSSS